MPTTSSAASADRVTSAGAENRWTEMRSYIGLDILAKSRLTKITDPNPIDPEVTITAITA